MVLKRRLGEKGSKSWKDKEVVDKWSIGFKAGIFLGNNKL